MTLRGQSLPERAAPRLLEFVFLCGSRLGRDGRESFGSRQHRRLHHRDCKTGRGAPRRCTRPPVRGGDQGVWLPRLTHPPGRAAPAPCGQAPGVHRPPALPSSQQQLGGAGASHQPPASRLAPPVRADSTARPPGPLTSAPPRCQGRLCRVCARRERKLEDGTLGEQPGPRLTWLQRVQLDLLGRGQHDAVVGLPEGHHRRRRQRHLRGPDQRPGLGRLLDHLGHSRSP